MYLKDVNLNRCLVKFLKRNPYFLYLIHQLLGLKPLYTRVRKPRLLYFLFNGLEPISDLYGFDRGKPIDRYYIEDFLEKNKDDIQGICLEILDNNYTLRFGGKQVVRSDILDIDKTNKKATIYGDLRKLSNVKSNTYDCIILTQVLHFIDNFFLAISECKRILKNNGVMLVTLPSISRIDCVAGIKGDYWRFTTASAKYVFEKFFKEENLTIKAYGNVLTGLNFWIGSTCEEISKEKLDYIDPNFPCLITIRAKK